MQELLLQKINNVQALSVRLLNNALLFSIKQFIKNCCKYIFFMVYFVQVEYVNTLFCYVKIILYGGFDLDKLVIRGGTPLKGEVSISGAKNAAVAILPASLLLDGVCTIENLPNISDVKFLCDIIESLGAKITWVTPNCITIDSRNLACTNAPLELTRKFRASYYLIGALLGRCKNVMVGMPGRV